jgi:hypothetical protein
VWPVDRVGLYFAPSQIAIQSSQALGIATLKLWLLSRISSAEGRRPPTRIPAKAEPLRSRVSFLRARRSGAVSDPRVDLRV